MPQLDLTPEQSVICSEVKQHIATTDVARKLQLVPAPRKLARRRKRDLGARLKAILVGRFQERGLPTEAARLQADVCLGLALEYPTDIRPLRRKIVAIR